MVDLPPPPLDVLRAALDGVDDAVFVTDAAWHPQWCNRAGEALLSALPVDAASEFARDGVVALLDSTSRVAFLVDAVEALARGVAWSADGALVAPPRPVTVSVLGAPGGARVVRFRDESRVRHLEERLRRAAVLEGVGGLALTLSHDFAELLTAIIGSAELLVDDLPPSHPLRDDAGAIARSADRAAALTRELTAAAAARGSAPQLVDIARALGAIVPTLRRLVGPDVAVRLAIDEALPPTRVDVGELEGMLHHLARNAASAMPRGGTLTVAAELVASEGPALAVHGVIRPGRYVRVIVGDDGTGMDEATRSRAFEPRWSGHGRRGVGLSLVFGTVTRMGGYVTCESALGSGTRVALWLPEAPHTPPMGQVASGDTPPSILLVDDEELVRRVVARTLRREGFRVVEAADADEALSLVSADPTVADVLVTDVAMPGLSGIDLARCIVAARPDVRVLFSSGAPIVNVEDTQRLPRGAAFIPKPFTARALGARVRELLVG